MRTVNSPPPFGMHRLGAVQNEIQNHLLDLRRVALHQWQIFLQLQSRFRIHQLQFVADQAQACCGQVCSNRRERAGVWTGGKMPEGP